MNDFERQQKVDLFMNLLIDLAKNKAFIDYLLMYDITENDYKEIKEWFEEHGINI